MSKLGSRLEKGGTHTIVLIAYLQHTLNDRVHEIKHTSLRLWVCEPSDEASLAVLRRVDVAMSMESASLCTLLVQVPSTDVSENATTIWIVLVCIWVHAEKVFLKSTHKDLKEARTNHWIPRDAMDPLCIVGIELAKLVLIHCRPNWNAIEYKHDRRVDLRRIQRKRDRWWTERECEALST